jgi:NADPH:quinone reductase-like Zn-dependent oxidoreductase
VLENREGDVVRWAREVTGGRGVEMVLDHVGTALFGASLFALGVHGRLVNCGNTSGDAATIPSLGYVFHSAISILGSGPYEPDEFAPAWANFCTGGFDPVVDDVLALDEAAEAHRRLERGDVVGKVLLQP